MKFELEMVGKVEEGGAIGSFCLVKFFQKQNNQTQKHSLSPFVSISQIFQVTTSEWYKEIKKKKKTHKNHNPQKLISAIRDENGLIILPKTHPSI